MKTAKKEEVSLETMETTYLSIDNEISLLNKQKEFLKTSIIEHFEKNGIKKDDLLQLIVQKRVKIDDLALKATLTVPLWNKIKKETVDKDKLDAAVKMGEIEEETAERAMARTEVKYLQRC